MHPPIQELEREDLALGEASDGFVGPRRGGNAVWFAPWEIEHGAPVRIYASGIRELDEQLVRSLNERGLIGVYVAPHDEDIDPTTGRDLRPEGRTTLRLVIYTGYTEGLRTFAAGGRLDEEDRSQSAAHAVIRSGSPVQPAGVDGRTQGDLLFQPELDDYLAYLNRHPGRRVDLSVTPTREPGGVYVDYLVAEEKPWTAYAQWSNTGTDETTDNRQHFGFRHTQLTGRDDVAQLDYVTGDFDEVNAAFGSYELPIPLGERTRLRTRGLWSDYDASQFGLGNAFQGTQWGFGTELVVNLLQNEELFVDGTLGGRWMDVEVTNLNADDGEENFLVPRAGIEVQRLGDTRNFWGRAGFEMNLDSVAGTSDDEEDLFLLGRPEIDADWMLFNWFASYSFYLDPLVQGRAWKNPRTWRSSTVAHEMLLRTAGQYAFDRRLIPQVQYVLGGYYTVRGYPQATIAADSGAFASAEYRLHLPRLLSPRPPANLPLLGAFRFAPERVYGRPDYDLVLRGFYDLGRAVYSDSVPGEEDETLQGVGVGIELVVRRFLSLRLDYGIALSDVRDVESGDSETYFVATFRY
jgi:hemolysin activation/secretion protein